MEGNGVNIMGTITKYIADAIILDEYSDDNITKIVTYNNMFDGSLTYACVFAQEDQMKYELSPACHNVSIYWERKS